MTVKIIAYEDGAIVKSPYNRAFVYDLKSYIPSIGRSWRFKTEVIYPNTWWVDPKYIDIVIMLVNRHYSEDVSYAKTLTYASQKRMRGTVTAHYVGGIRKRETGERGGFGLSDKNAWDIYFPNNVVERFFRSWADAQDDEDQQLPQKPITLYDILGCPPAVDESELKKYYRKAALQWHPDVCKEPNATEMFKSINEAYTTLSDPRKRKLYNIALKDTATQLPELPSYDIGRRSRWGDYTPPMRSGVIDCDYVICLGRRSVKKIYSWNEVTDAHGRVLVSSWNSITDSVDKQWV